jgi:FlaG/FlaF family flagellin (archaellin)
MKVAAAVVLAGAFAVVAYPRVDAAEPQASAQSNQKPTATTGENAPPPITVEVIAVDPKANTITVREIAAVPAPPGKAVDVKLDVPASATGQKLGDTKPGEKVAVTCEIKPTVHKEAGVPLVLTDCLKVIKIDPKS